MAALTSRKVFKRLVKKDRRVGKGLE